MIARLDKGKAIAQAEVCRTIASMTIRGAPVVRRYERKCMALPRRAARTCFERRIFCANSSRNRRGIVVHDLAVDRDRGRAMNVLRSFEVFGNQRLCAGTEAIANFVLGDTYLRVTRVDITAIRVHANVPRNNDILTRELTAAVLLLRNIYDAHGCLL